jgi:5'-3' exonuclease
MGVPYYFYILTQKYKNILCSIKQLSTDIFCIDFNGIIHNSAQDIMKLENINSEDIFAIENKIIDNVWSKIEYYINTFNAEKYIICADGVAPVAKMFQQRKRRYLNIYRNNLDEGFVTKPLWDTNAITPGTFFMNKLNIYIHKKIRYSTYNIEFIYSGSDENGEGEHKIFHKLKIAPENANIIIHGLDADLIILSLMSHHNNIYLMRETKDKETNETVYNYLNIKNLREAILTEIKDFWELKSTGIKGIKYTDNDLIETYCTMCSILGNDFIPHLLTIDLKTDGINKLISATKKAIQEQDLLVIDGEINYECLKCIFNYLSKSEDRDIHSICEKYIYKKMFNSSDIPSDYYALKNKDKLVYYIYNNPSKWHKEYYKEIFSNNYTIDSTVMFNACDNYIIGIFWVYQYYKGNDIDCEWYYPYNYPPTIKDISNHAIARETPQINKNNSFVKADVQLLIVLPRESAHLLKSNNKKYMNDIYSGLFHMYPIKYKIQTFLKTHLWECSPILPLINVKYINKVLEL